MKKSSALRSIASALLVTLAWLVVLEVGFRIAEYVHHRVQSQAWNQEKTNTLASLYVAYPWGADFIKESARYNFTPRYQAFEEFRMMPFAGKTIHVGEDGYRAVPGRHPDARVQVEVFGGSTIAGSGVADEATVPAFLQQRFNRRGTPVVNVANHGVGGWVNAQETVALAEELKHGHVPDVVIFYDGVNDMVRTAQNIEAGTTWFKRGLTDFFLGNNALVEMVATRRGWPGSHLFGFVFRQLREHGVRVRFVPFLERGAYDMSWPLYHEYAHLSEERRDQLADATIANYLDNVRFVRRLAAIYKFDVYFFWQPMLYPSVTKKTLTPFEQHALQGEPYGYIDLAARVTPRIRRHPEIRDLTGALDDLPETVFIDGAHLLAPGNERIADRIFDVVKSSKKFSLGRDWGDC